MAEWHDRLSSVLNDLHAFADYFLRIGPRGGKQYVNERTGKVRYTAPKGQQGDADLVQGALDGTRKRAATRAARAAKAVKVATGSGKSGVGSGSATPVSVPPAKAVAPKVAKSARSAPARPAPARPSPPPRDDDSLIPDDVGLAPEPTLASQPPTSSRTGSSRGGAGDYIDRVHSVPAAERLADIKFREEKSGMPFASRVLNEVINDPRVKLPGSDKYRERVTWMSLGGRVSESDAQGMRAFRAHVVDAIKRGDVDPEHVANALERVDSQRYGTMKYDEFMGALKGGTTGPSHSFADDDEDDGEVHSYGWEPFVTRAGTVGARGTGEHSGQLPRYGREAIETLNASADEGPAPGQTWNQYRFEKMRRAKAATRSQSQPQPQLQSPRGPGPGQTENQYRFERFRRDRQRTRTYAFAWEPFTTSRGTIGARGTGEHAGKKPLYGDAAKRALGEGGKRRGVSPASPAPSSPPASPQPAASVTAPHSATPSPSRPDAAAIREHVRTAQDVISHIEQHYPELASSPGMQELRAAIAEIKRSQAATPTTPTTAPTPVPVPPAELAPPVTARVAPLPAKEAKAVGSRAASQPATRDGVVELANKIRQEGSFEGARSQIESMASTATLKQLKDIAASLGVKGVHTKPSEYLTDILESMSAVNSVPFDRGRVATMMGRVKEAYDKTQEVVRGQGGDATVKNEWMIPEAVKELRKADVGDLYQLAKEFGLENVKRDKADIIKRVEAKLKSTSQNKLGNFV